MDETEVIEQAANVALSIGVLLASVLVSILLYIVTFRTLFRLGRSDVFALEATRRCKWPARTTVVLLGLLVGMPFTRLPLEFTDTANHVLLILAIVGISATFMRLSVAVEIAILDSLEIGSDNNARARGRKTKVILLRRVAAGMIAVVAIGGILLTFESARSIGTSLLASAGIIGLVAGVAAQATLGNIIAGIQLATTEPLRIDDVVVVEGEWGNIEEVSLTYVVVRIWDRRRLVLPTSYFMTTPFQNWTRHGSQVIGSIFWELDHRTPAAAMREEFHRQVNDHPLWDGDVAVLQVVESLERTIKVRGLVTAKDSGAVWDLRCAIRESMLHWLVTTQPQSLPTTRVLQADVAQGHGEDPGRITWVNNPSPDPTTEPAPDPLRTGEWPIIDHAADQPRA